MQFKVGDKIQVMTRQEFARHINVARREVYFDGDAAAGLVGTIVCRNGNISCWWGCRFPGWGIGHYLRGELTEPNGQWIDERALKRLAPLTPFQQSVRDYLDSELRDG